VPKGAENNLGFRVCVRTEERPKQVPPPSTQFKPRRRPQTCHPDRSEAKWRDLLVPCTVNQFKPRRRPQTCHPDRSEAKWRDLRFPQPFLDLARRKFRPKRSEVEGPALAFLGLAHGTPTAKAVPFRGTSFYSPWVGKHTTQSRSVESGTGPMLRVAAEGMQSIAAEYNWPDFRPKGIKK